MSDAKRLAIAAFKRKKDLKCAHIVHGYVFEKLDEATRFKNAWNASTVTSILRTECEDALRQAQGDSPSNDDKKTKSTKTKTK